jgi:hypothetical protein
MAATYPVQAPFNTSPSYSGTFIPEIWSAKLNQKFYAATVFGEIANTNWEGEIKGMGDKVLINNIPTLSINAYTVGQALTYEVPAPNSIEMLIDKGYYFGFQVNDVLEYQSKPKLMDIFSNDAAMQMKIKVDRECLAATFNQGAAANMGAGAGVLSGGYALGTDLAPIDVTTTPAKLLQMVTALSSVLDEQNVPDTDRFLLMTPYDRQVLMQTNLAQAQFMGDPNSIIRSGRIGSIDRFTIYVTNLLPTGAAGRSWTDANGTDTAVASTLKRRAMMAGHKSGITFAAQIAKTETLRNPTDFGDYVRGLNVYGRKVVLPPALALGVVT